MFSGSSIKKNPADFFDLFDTISLPQIIYLLV